MGQMAGMSILPRSEPDPLLEVPTWLALRRIVQNKLNDHNMT
jgi:hypothetical protein